MHSPIPARYQSSIDACQENHVRRRDGDQRRRGGETIDPEAVICAVPGTNVLDIIPDVPEVTRRALSTVS